MSKQWGKKEGSKEKNNEESRGGFPSLKHVLHDKSKLKGRRGNKGEKKKQVLEKKTENMREKLREIWGLFGRSVLVMQQTIVYTKITFKIPFTKKTTIIIIIIINIIIITIFSEPIVVVCKVAGWQSMLYFCQLKLNLSKLLSI